MHAIAGVAARMDEASTAVFLTAAFGVNDLLAEMLEQEEPYYRYVLIESEDKDTERLAPRFNEVAVANILPHNEFDHSLAEQLFGFNTRVKYAHTKYIFIDSLGDAPV
jgi:hypothetical protein